MSNLDLMKMFIEAAMEDGDKDHMVHVIGKLQELMVTMFSLYILLEYKEHENHDSDCEVATKIPAAIESFKSQLLQDLDMHVEINLKANGFTLDKTHNQKVFDDIMRDIQARDKR